MNLSLKRPFFLEDLTIRIPKEMSLFPEVRFPEKPGQFKLVWVQK